MYCENTENQSREEKCCQDFKYYLSQVLFHLQDFGINLTGVRLSLCLSYNCLALVHHLTIKTRTTHLVREQDDIAYDQCKYLLGLWMDFKRASFIRSFICPNSESFSWNSTPTYIPQLSSEKYRVTFLLEKIYILLVGLSCTHHPRFIFVELVP